MRRSIQLPLRPRTWGGARAGAGRPAGARRRVPHRRRPPHEARYPVHGTLRVRAALPSLRGAGVFRAVSDALAASSRRGFRVLEFSVQSNHIHLLVEADDRTRLSRGLQGLKIRIARAVNRTLHRRGTFWAERYDARALATPREVRTALVYVLRNGHRHGTCRRGFDPCSSAAWFTGWKCSRPRPICLAPVVRPQTWLASVGWRRHGLIGIAEEPVPAGRVARRGALPWYAGRPAGCFPLPRRRTCVTPATQGRGVRGARAARGSPGRARPHAQRRARRRR